MSDSYKAGKRGKYCNPRYVKHANTETKSQDWAISDRHMQGSTEKILRRCRKIWTRLLGKRRRATGKKLIVSQLKENMIQSKHTLSYCNQCECEMVLCSVCNNNCCNGGSGKTINGSDCDCKEAYEHQDIYSETPEMITFEKDIRAEKKTEGPWSFSRRVLVIHP
jgi:hypothetical protein